MTQVRLFDRNRLGLPLVAILSALSWFGFLILRSLTLTEGNFTYPLDDSYIHLAMAEGILSGTYGINPGEVAAASSSPVWPFLLAVLGAGKFAPLILNALSLALAAGLLGGLLGRAGLSMRLALPLAAIAPIALNMPPLALLGMEHTAHLAAALGLLLGLHRALVAGRSNWLLWVCAVAGPAMRFEALALVELSALVLFVAGQRRLAVGVGLVGLLPVAGFALFLMGQGLSPIPASVLVKLGEAGTGDGLLAKLALNLTTRIGLVLAFLAGTAGLLAVTARDRAEKGTLIAVALAVLAHLAFGRIGWAYRYENYALVLGSVAVLAFGLSRVQARTGLVAGVAFVAVLGTIHWPNLTIYGPQSARGMYLQQAQMARLAQDVWQGPVAVNDIGMVAFQNETHVADLWGLAAPEAFALRMDPARVQGWADPMLARHDIGLAMIYTASLPRAPGPGWVKMGALDQAGPAPYLAGLLVDIYATGPGHVAALAAALDRWARDLPQGATFAPTGAGQ